MEKTPSKIGVEKTPSKRGVEKTPSKTGVEKTPSKIGVEKTPSKRGMGKTPSKSGTKNRNKRNNRSRRKNKTIKEIKILYCNANGIRGKIKSIESAAKTQAAHIIAITETKGPAPKIEGYSNWYEKTRNDTRGGGVAIAVREDLINKCQPVEDIEDQNQEVKWIQLSTHHNNKVYIGVYYGKQEKEPIENVEREFSQIKAQIAKLKNKGPIILTGDFNAKIKIDKNQGKTTQEVSRNGKYLEDLLEDQDLIPISTKAHPGTWTRVNRNNPLEKSVIDYIIIRKIDEINITENIVDEEGTLRIKGNKETDHNTMTISFKCPLSKTTRVIKKWKLNNREGWAEYNARMATINRDIVKNYDAFEKEMNKILEETVGSVKIRVGKRTKPHMNEEQKQLKNKVKQLRKKFQEAVKNNSDEKGNILEQYIDSQKKLRSEIQLIQQEQTRNLVRKIIEEGGTKSTTFWRAKRKICGKQGAADYITIDEKGKPIENPEEAKEHIAEYFENLYKARESRPEYETWTKKIKEEIEKIEQSEEINNKPATITQEEIKNTVKKLKKGKAPGPDNLPNEALKEANEETLEIIRQVFDNISQEKNIPEQWQKGNINRLYKGKGKRGKCSNERGITLSSNIGKAYERIINDRAHQEVHMSNDQAGGKKGTATVDHLAILSEAINEARKNKKTVYMVFLDVTKAYDKAWLDAIMYVMHKEGLNTPEWDIIRKMNQNLTAKIQTQYGQTREIKIKDSIRQGGVLSGLQYALMMDEIGKEIKQRNLGIYIPSLQEKIGCLLWMDDVIHITTEPKEMQEMLDITDDLSGRYHIEFGEPKSKAMKIGGGKTKPEFKLGKMTLGYCDKYKYLGVLKNEKNNMKDQIQATKGKVEAAYQTILAIAGNRAFADMEMRTIWELIECTIVPIITYGSEVWNPNKTETKALNSIMDNILKRVLMAPQSTPREALYIETGLLDPETISLKQKIMMDYRLKNSQNPRMKTLTTAEVPNLWRTSAEKAKERLNISTQDTEGKKPGVKTRIKNKTAKYFKDKITADGQDKSKIKYLTEGRTEWRPFSKQKYLADLSRTNASTVFMARTRMLDVKNNFRNKYPDVICRACGKETETQEHVLETCQTLHMNPSSKVSKSDVFKVTALKARAKIIRSLQEKTDKPNLTIPLST